MKARLLITDLDNTLYDWVSYYIPSFLAMVSELSKITGIGEEDLKSSFKRVHEAHRCTEYAFAIEELDILRDPDRLLTPQQRLQKYAPAIAAFREQRSKLLTLYPGVVSTLTTLKRSGTIIAALTDATTYYASRRLRQLGIEDLFDVLCAPEDHGIPDGLDASVVRKSSNPGDYETSIPCVLYSGGFRKPDPELISMILKATNTDASLAFVVGDSLYRDVKMAQAAGVLDVFAAYGAEIPRPLYAELLKITYWTAADVAEYDKLTAEVVKPAISIRAFSDIINIASDLDTARCNFASASS